MSGFKSLCGTKRTRLTRTMLVRVKQNGVAKMMNKISNERARSKEGTVG